MGLVDKIFTLSELKEKKESGYAYYVSHEDSWEFLTAKEKNTRQVRSFSDNFDFFEDVEEEDFDVVETFRRWIEEDDLYVSLDDTIASWEAAEEEDERYEKEKKRWKDFENREIVIEFLREDGNHLVYDVNGNEVRVAMNLLELCIDAPPYFKAVGLDERNRGYGFMWYVCDKFISIDNGEMTIDKKPGELVWDQWKRVCNRTPREKFKKY